MSTLNLQVVFTSIFAAHPLEADRETADTLSVTALGSANYLINRTQPTLLPEVTLGSLAQAQEAVEEYIKLFNAHQPYNQDDWRTQDRKVNGPRAYQIKGEPAFLNLTALHPSWYTQERYDAHAQRTDKTNTLHDKPAASIPEGATHTRDEDFYRISDRVQTFHTDAQEWRDCQHPEDLEYWEKELTPIEA
jgi:hypothetical protein